jgi:hypothetical protein
MQCPLKEQCGKELENRTIKKTRLLLGEGIDEKNFFDAFLRHLGRERDVQTMHYGGKDHRRGFLGLLSGTKPEFTQVERLAVTGDADDDYAAVVARIRGELQECGLAQPEDRDFAELGGKRVGLFVCDRQLETICLNSLAGTPELACIEAFLRCLNVHYDSQNEMEKVKCRSYLAYKDGTTLSVGIGAIKNYWNLASPAFSGLRDFLLNFTA